MVRQIEERFEKNPPPPLPGVIGYKIQCHRFEVEKSRHEKRPGANRDVFLRSSGGDECRHDDRADDNAGNG
jgi:hypothetical protein|tara:strand:+ start:470 stop:682 length:213 start_codon:yes stop_codon:yes gene_type:complete